MLCYKWQIWTFFFGPLKWRDIFSDHLLWFIFWSSLHTYYTLKIMLDQMGSHGLPWSSFIDPHYDGIQIQINNSFLFRINNSLPCRDLNPGPPGTKQIAYQCAIIFRCKFELVVNGSNGRAWKVAEAVTCLHAITIVLFCMSV